MRKQTQRTIAGIVAATMLNACIAPQQHTWKTESVISTSYKPVRQETEQQDTYKIVEKVSETGTLDFKVWIGKYGVNYDVVQPINLTREREYNYGRSKVAAAFVDAGLATLALGILLEFTTSTTYCEGPYSDPNMSCYQERGSTGAHLVLLSGLAIGGFSSWAYWGIHKKDRPTKITREVEIPAETYQRNLGDQTLLETVPAINAPVSISSSYFTMNGRQATTINTNYNGYGTVQLVPTSQNFSFSLDQLANTDAAHQLSAAGIAQQKYLPLLQQAAVPISYDVTIETKATDGKNATVTIPIKGYEIPQRAMEDIIMGL